MLAIVFIALSTAAAWAVGRKAAAGPEQAAPSQAGGAASTAPYAAIIEALPDPILLVLAGDPDDFTSRRYVFANAAARDLLKIDRSEGLLVSVIRDPQVLETVDEALFGRVEAECLYEIGGAQTRTLKAQARPLDSAADDPRLALLIFRDETEFRRVERMRADFLANASHELRTPLASLSGFIETLRGHAKGDPVAQDRFLGIMQAQAERMSRLINDLMSLSRIELNEYIAPDDVVDLKPCVMDVVDAVTPLARERGVTFDLDLPEAGVARIQGDRDQIVQVIQNLVDNALKYSPSKGVVRVRLATPLGAEAAVANQRPGASKLSLLTPDRPDETYAVLRVMDQGAGIARENLPRLTERFYRVEGQKSGEKLGTGLGLAIVKHIANRHRGGMAVESAVGEGTTFTVYFPALSPAIAESNATKVS